MTQHNRGKVCDGRSFTLERFSFAKSQAPQNFSSKAGGSFSVKLLDYFQNLNKLNYELKNIYV